MCASPHDLTEDGHEPVRIETSAGRAEYVRAQSALAERSAELRQFRLEVCTTLLTHENTVLAAD
ncbi:hypothetical protein OG874_09105 [Nocardia sp. NBC_00565]|uniref:hypothetical protein n=1 Tax=Nocardia sp. NBC_00565 TaxID=2975993 RepID=UPI002E801B26|nr:hypothetical protein [Nocardia sp. NBC_00565]WUC05283.1 hypothetical protein OG874_09105 [Nocardia sp. NBC_00565]